MLTRSEPLYTAAEMRAAEEAYPGYPETIPELMERAGARVAEAVATRYPDARRITVVCGGGSNGGDGRVAARLLGEGRDVRVVDVSEDEPDELGDPDVVIDAIFGTGFRGAPRPAAARYRRINALGRPVVAVDVPSGVDASTGEVAGAAVDAALTVTFHGPKVGLHVAPGRFHAGDVEIADIGLDGGRHRAPARRRGRSSRSSRPSATATTSTRPARCSWSAALRGLTGAACLAAEAAFRADAGYVAVAAPGLVAAGAREPPARGRQTAAQRGLAGRASLRRPSRRSSRQPSGCARSRSAPGWAAASDTQAVVRRALAELDLPVVVDAGRALGARAGTRAAPTILTPHEGELARLLGETSGWVAAHRLEALRRAVERFRCIVLLKGADTLIGAPGEPTLVVSGNVPAARHRRHRRRPDRGSSPPSSPRASTRACRRRGRRVAHRRAARLRGKRPRARRERRRRRAPGSSWLTWTSSPASSRTRGGFIAEELLRRRAARCARSARARRRAPAAAPVQEGAAAVRRSRPAAPRPGGADTLYNTYWIRYEQGGRSFDAAVREHAHARRGGARRRRRAAWCTSPSPTRRETSAFAYFRGQGRHRARGRARVAVRSDRAADARLRRGATCSSTTSPGSCAASRSSSCRTARVQPVAGEDVAELASPPAKARRSTRPGPRSTSSSTLVRMLGRAAGGRARVVRAPTRSALGLTAVANLFLRDVVVDARGARRPRRRPAPVSSEPPRGRRSFADWVEASGPQLGTRTCSELARNFRPYAPV